jgi:hypothetical protein
MSDEPRAEAAAPLFQEIKTLPPERAYKFRSLRFLTYATAIAVGLNGILQVAQFGALLGRWGLLSQMANHGFSSHDAMMAAAEGSDTAVRVTAMLTLMSLLPAYVVSSFWIYNAACNIRALGARGMQISPGWAVGWFAVPVASLVMPFQGIEEIYLASITPVGWRKLQTPALLRGWWGAWLLAGLGGAALGLLARAMTTLPALVIATRLLLLDVGVDIVACVLFLAIVWRVFRAQARSRTQAGQVAQVFA